jgi:CRISPR-associated protein Csm3
MNEKIKIQGRVFIAFNILAITGLHIGGTDTGIEIGGVENTVLRDTLTNRPYIPGSSLKGKMRSLLEKYKGLKQNQLIGQGYIHSCGADYTGNDVLKKGKPEYLNCDVCQVFGVPGEREFSTPTRLVVRDVPMDDDSADKLNETGRTDLPYTEVKTEVSIDRVTSAAHPRPVERVPAGTVFGRAELVYSIYAGADCDPGKDVERFRVLVEGMQLLEDDYLGGHGTRGSGKVQIREIEVKARPADGYLAEPKTLGKYPDLKELVGSLNDLQNSLRKEFGLT